jgi:hypothetical protein
MKTIERLITEALASVNDTLDGVSFRYWPQATGQASARIERWDDRGPIKIEAAGTERECWQFVNGLEAALEVTNRLPVG